MDKLGIEPATAQLELGLGLSLAIISTTRIPFEEICTDKKMEHVYIIPHPIINQQMGLDSCEAISMKMMVPKNHAVHEKIISGGNSNAIRSKC